jgi:adenosylmethionine-8-amino-7-oxononanoate aminotransferase
MYGVELVADKNTREPFPASRGFGAKVVAACQKRRMFVQSGAGNHMGVAGDMLFLGPAFTVSFEEIDKITGILENSIREAEEA